MIDVYHLLEFGIVVVTLAGGAVAFFRKQLGDSLIAYQAKELDLAKDTITRLEKEGAAKDARIKTLEEQNVVLKELAQGSPKLLEFAAEIKRLADIMAKHFKEKN